RLHAIDEDEDTSAPGERAQRPAGLAEAAAVGERSVEDDHIGTEPGGLTDGLRAAGGFGHDANVGFGAEQRAEPRPHEFVSVGDHYLDASAAVHQTDLPVMTPFP